MGKNNGGKKPGKSKSKGKGKGKAKAKAIKWKAPEFFCKAGGCGRVIPDSADVDCFRIGCCSELCVSHYHDEVEQKRKKEEAFKLRQAEILREIREEKERRKEYDDYYKERKRLEEEQLRRAQEREREMRKREAVQKFDPPARARKKVQVIQQEAKQRKILAAIAQMNNAVDMTLLHLSPEARLAVTHIRQLQSVVDSLTGNMFRKLKSGGYGIQARGYSGDSVTTLKKEIASRGTGFYHTGKDVKVRVLLDPI